MVDNVRVSLGSIITIMLISLAITIITPNPISLAITIVSAIGVVGIAIYSNMR
jgi:hypothetical protein